jgi:hypothetical protein
MAFALLWPGRSAGSSLPTASKLAARRAAELTKSSVLEGQARRTGYKTSQERDGLAWEDGVGVLVPPAGHAAARAPVDADQGGSQDGVAVDAAAFEGDQAEGGGDGEAAGGR